MMTPTLSVVASSARTTSSQTATFALADRKLATVISVFVNVTAVSGTAPTLDLSVEWSPDAGTTWYAAGDTFAQITAAGGVVKQFTPKAPHYRVRWVVAGTTPSFTFTVTEIANTP